MHIIDSTYFDPPQKFSKNFSCTLSSSSGTNSKTPTADFEFAGKVFGKFLGRSK
jgi:hypothetical protein